MRTKRISIQNCNIPNTQIKTIQSNCNINVTKPIGGKENALDSLIFSIYSAVSITTEKATTTVIPMLPSTEKLVPDSK